LDARMNCSWEDDMLLLRRRRPLLPPSPGAARRAAGRRGRARSSVTMLTLSQRLKATRRKKMLRHPFNHYFLRTRVVYHYDNYRNFSL
jgi:hypothetical protein